MTSLGPFRSISTLVVVRIVSSILQFATLILITRSVPLEEFGDYSTALAVGAVLSGILGFGLMTRALRVGAESSVALARPIVIITLFSALLVAGVVVAVFFVGNGELAWWIIAAAAYVAAEMVNGIVQSTLFGESRHKRAELIIILRRAIPFTAILLATLLVPLYVFQVAAGGFAASAVVALAVFGRHTWDGWHLRSLFVGSVQYWLSSVWSMLQQLDVVIVNTALGSGPAGAYAAGFRLASPIHIITSSLISLMVPRLSHIENREERRRAGRPFTVGAVAYAATLLVLSPLAFFGGPFLFGMQFLPFAWIFPVFVASSAFSVLSQVQAARLYTEGVAKPVTRNIAISTVTGLVLAVAGAQFGDVVTVAICIAGSQLLLAILHWRTWATWRVSEDRKADSDGE